MYFTDTIKYTIISKRSKIRQKKTKMIRSSKGEQVRRMIPYLKPV